MKEINEILESGILSGFRGYPEGHLGGKHVQALEKAFRDYFNVKYAISFNSATAALHAALVACGVGLGDEVIVSPYSFSSSASCVLMVGAKPVFADINEDTFCIDPYAIARVMTPKTKAIIPVHLMGHPIKFNIYADRKIRVIEDCAQAIGATYKGQKVGTIGDCGIFSFNQSKHINTGEGGMMITSDNEIAAISRAVRNHGEVSVPDLKVLGYNYRMCEIEAAIGLEQFRRLDELIDIRVNNANRLTEALSQIDGLTPPVVYPNFKHVFYTYGVKFDSNKMGMHRDVFQDKMIENGVYFGKGYVKPLYLLPIYEQFGYKEGLCPVTERMWKDELMVTDLVKHKDLDVDHIVEVIKALVL